MPAHPPLAGRSAANWGVRAVLAVGAAWLGYGAVTHALAYSIRGGDIERAYALSPRDGRIGAILSEARLTADPGPAGRDDAERIARSALRHEPLAVAAVATLGINAELAGDKDRARQILTHAQALSRRDLRTQLWAIEDAVGRGDIVTALRHYDIALRTSRVAPELLFPVLSGAVEQPDIRAALVRTLGTRPAWGAAFVEHAAAHAPAPRATAAFLRSLRRARFPVSAAAGTLMVNSLLAANMVDDAWSYYTSIRPGTDPRRSRDPDFATVPENPSSFDWTILNDAGITTSIQRGEDGGIFDFAAPSGAGGPVLRQMQMLPPGRYALTGRSAGIDQPEASRPYWLLACTDGRELGRVALPNSGQDGGIFAGGFTVPGGCPVQMLSLVARPSDMVGGATGQIERVALRPAG